MTSEEMIDNAIACAELPATIETNGALAESLKALAVAEMTTQELIDAADVLTTALNDDAALPATIKTSDVLADALKALGVAVTTRMRDAGRGSVWHPGKR